MWSALINGGGGGAGGGGGGGGGSGGYVQSQGWEFVPCYRMDRATDRGGRAKARNPLRRISSPPAVFSQVCSEPQAGAGEGDAGAKVEKLRGQMWPPEPPPPQQQQQQQHSRLKKKLDELKKRHVQDKEEWSREKESLLREVADIQGGENRRILLDLKTVLEEVQTEVKREEEKRSELQLQYTRDRCSWELEKAELKCRIAQLEAREGSGAVGRRLLSAVGPGTSRSIQEQHGEAGGGRRDREEPRRVPTDAHPAAAAAAAMDLRYRLEHSERDWLREKADLLERFDVERREWEGQLRDMQKKIEELYCEVRAKREGTRVDADADDDAVHSPSVHSSSTGSSLFSSSTRSQPRAQPPSLPGFGHSRSAEPCSSGFFHADGPCDFSHGPQAEPGDEFRSRGSWQRDRVDRNRESLEVAELAPGFGPSHKTVSNGNENTGHDGSVWADLRYGSDKKKNSTTLNAALKEIARVSEELCSYQDEIRKKSEEKRNQPESLSGTDEGEMLFSRDKNSLQDDDPQCDLSQIYDDFRALEKENWMSLSPGNTWRSNLSGSESWRRSAAAPHSYAESPGLVSEVDAAAPPIPPRFSSWNLSNPTSTDTDLHIPDSPVPTARKCHSPCILVETRKCNSPSIVRKFEAMLQENEGKVFIDGAVASCAAPSSPKCNVGCCHSRWSCDASKFINSKSTAYGTVQKSFSEMNIRSAGRDVHSDPSTAVRNFTNADLPMPPLIQESSADLFFSSLDNKPPSPDLHSSRRNITLEQKTAEFNRTLFHADMGHGVKEKDCFTVTEVYPPTETGCQPHGSGTSSGVISGIPEVIPDSTFHDPELPPRQMRHSLEVQEEDPYDLPFEDPQVGFVETQSPVQQPELRHKHDRRTRPRAATDSLFSELSNQPGATEEVSISNNSSTLGAKTQSAAGQEPRLQRNFPGIPSLPDSCRHGPRMMTEHPWKPLTLAAYPRPEGSRSNYGAVERILKNYESAARAQQNQNQKNEMRSSPRLCIKPEEAVADVDMLDMDPLPSPPTLRHTHTVHSTHTQLGSHTVLGARDSRLIVQEHQDSAPKCFSRPARPANRRLPSRWASRSPTSSSSSSSSPSSTPVVPPMCPLQRHAPSFTYSHAFHMETVII